MLAAVWPEALQRREAQAWVRVPAVVVLLDLIARGAVEAEVSAAAAAVAAVTMTAAAAVAAVQDQPALLSH